MAGTLRNSYAQLEHFKAKKGGRQFNVPGCYAGHEHKLGQDDNPATADGSISAFDGNERQLGAGDGPLLLDVATEAEQLGRPAAGFQ